MGSATGYWLVALMGVLLGETAAVAGDALTAGATGVVGGIKGAGVPAATGGTAGVAAGVAGGWAAGVVMDGVPGVTGVEVSWVDGTTGAARGFDAAWAASTLLGLSLVQPAKISASVRVAASRGARK